MSWAKTAAEKASSEKPSERRFGEETDIATPF
jgi:hypothetical protein